FLYRDRVEKVKPDDVKAVAAKYLRRSNRTVGVFVPVKEADRVAVAAAPDVEAQLRGYTGRATTVAEGEAFDPTPENIDKRTRGSTLSGGVKAALLLKKSRGEEVDFSLTLRYGDLESLKGMGTAASMLPLLMNRGGTKTHSRQEVRDELDQLGARLTLAG